MRRLLLLLVFSLLLIGCSRFMIVCESPLVVINQTCCVDDNRNFVCDSRELVDEDDVVAQTPVKNSTSEVEMFGHLFAKTWESRNFKALHGMFVKDYKKSLNVDEFNFLARKWHDKGKITIIKAKAFTETTVLYGINTDTYTEVIATVKEENGELKHKQFYMFIGLTADDVCQNNDKCYRDYAVLVKEQIYCDKSGTYKHECNEYFGIKRDVSNLIDECMEIKDYYAMTECLERAAVKKDSIAPCWKPEFNRQKYMCMGKVAAGREDAEECDKMINSKGYGGTRQQEAYCIMGYVEETHNMTACKMMDRRSDIVIGAMYEDCMKLKFN